MIFDETSGFGVCGINKPIGMSWNDWDEYCNDCISEGVELGMGLCAPIDDGVGIVFEGMSKTKSMNWTQWYVYMYGKDTEEGLSPKL